MVRNLQIAKKFDAYIYLIDPYAWWEKHKWIYKAVFLEGGDFNKEADELIEWIMEWIID